MRRSALAALALTIALFAWAVIGAVALDSVNPEIRPAEHRIASVDSARRSRVLVLLLDGWRYDTAIDSAVMPHVAALRARGASGRLETVFEGFSLPAIKAAFSGSAETQLLNAVKNFHGAPLATESVFRDARRLGKSTLVVGEHAFVQFGDVVELRVPAPDPSLDMYAIDAKRPPMALAAYRDERYDVVLCHLESGDWIAHAHGVGAPAYIAGYRAIDSIVGVFAAARRPEDYFLVFGDHGHNLAGEHKTGLDIPSLLVVVGPDVTPGATFASLDIRNIRYIVSHALGIELAREPYQSSVLSRFLPVSASSEAPASAARGVSPRATDWLSWALFITVGLAIFVVSGAAAAFGRQDATALAALGLIGAGEIAAQVRWGSVASGFPVILAIVAATARMRNKRTNASDSTIVSLLLAGAAIYFLTRFSWTGDDLRLRIPTGLGAVSAVYAFGVVAKLIVLSRAGDATDRRGALLVVPLAAALMLVQVRAVEGTPILLSLIAIAIGAAVGLRSARHRRLGLVAALYLILYFTVRLPLFQYAWIDLLLGAALLASDRRVNVPALWREALVVTGAFALVSLWLPGGVEWEFLYDFFPAPVVELRVGWMLPLILLKIPLVLMLALVVGAVDPTTRLLALTLAYTMSRFVAAWVLKLAGATAADVWPLFEQGSYLLTFATAALWAQRLGRSRRLRSPEADAPDALPVVA